MSEPPSDSDRDLRRLIVVAVTVIAVVTVAEWGSSRLVSQDEPLSNTLATGKRPDNVTVIPRDPDGLPAPTQHTSVWVIGNSHTYALPGLQPGDRLQVDKEGIFVDEMAGRLSRSNPDTNVDFYLLAYPNFLPFEMLTRVGHLLYRGHRPTIVVLGLTWHNIARDSQLRHEIYAAYRDPAFCNAFERMLASPRVDADAEILEAVRTEQRRVEHDEEAERLKSDSDKIDEALTAWASDHLTLMRHSAALRAQLFRALTLRMQQMWRARVTDYVYDLVAHDYAFNRKCLQAMLRLLAADGATVVCYLAPERTDLAPMMDPRPQDEFIVWINDVAGELGIELLDARHVVPNEYWGWVGDAPDRSHFTEPGHKRMAEFLFEGLEQQPAWRELARP